MRMTFTAIASLVAFNAIAAEGASPSCQDILTPSEQLLAGEMAHWRGIAQLCRKSDGSNLNTSYWNTRLAPIQPNKKTIFANSVKSQTQAFVQQNGGPNVALKCDNWMDDVRNDWDAADPLSNAPPRGPIYFDEPTGLWRCKGTGEMDPLAGLNAIIDGL